jgi:hypothetical protein
MAVTEDPSALGVEGKNAEVRRSEVGRSAEVSVPEAQNLTVCLESGVRALPRSNYPEGMRCEVHKARADHKVA